MLGRPELEEVQCDMPYCYDEFDGTAGAKIACLGGPDGKQIMAFCAKHAEVLRSEGIELRTLRSIHDERDAEKRNEEQKKIASTTAIAQRTFIQTLKRQRF